MDTFLKKITLALKKTPRVTLPLFVSWFGVETPDVPKLLGISSANGIVDLVNSALTFIASLGGVVAVAMILYGGFLYVSSNGDAEKTKQAQGTITNALIGLVIIFMLRMVLVFVINLTFSL